MLKVNYSFLTAVRRLQTVMILDLNMLKAKTFKSRILNFWYLEKGFFFKERKGLLSCSEMYHYYHFVSRDHKILDGKNHVVC